MTSLYLDPNGNGTTQDWDVNDFTNVDDAARAPTVPVGGSGNRAELEEPADGEIVQWTCEDVPSTPGATTVFRLWVSDDDSTAGLFGVNVRINSVWQTQNTGFQDGSSGGWNYWDFSTSTDLTSGVTGNEIEIEAEGTTDNFYVDAVYIEVIYTPTTSSGNPWNYYAQQG